MKYQVNSFCSFDYSSGKLPIFLTNNIIIMDKLCYLTKVIVDINCGIEYYKYKNISSSKEDNG